MQFVSSVIKTNNFSTGGSYNGYYVAFARPS